MRKFIQWGLVSALMPSLAVGAPIPPAPYPVFLRLGFSSVLEFDDAPTRVVLGDSQAFQVERLEKSLVLRTLVAYATTNMFVYFKSSAPRLFVLTASEDAEPTYFRRIEEPKVPTVAPKSPPAPKASRPAPIPRKTQVVSAQFDTTKDYLTVEVILAADSSALLRPNWNSVRLRHQAKFQAPYKLWSERKEVQRDSSIRARFIFAKPNVPRALFDVALVIPIEGQASPVVLDLKGRGR